MESVCKYHWPCAKKGGWQEDFTPNPENVCPMGWKMDFITGNCKARADAECQSLTKLGRTDCEICDPEKNDKQRCTDFNAHKAGEDTGCNLIFTL
jgi:hypothetical protein